MKVVVRSNFTRSLKAAGRSVRYHAFRSRELDDERLGVFSRDSDNADVARFIRSLDDPLTRDRQTRRGTYAPAKLHRIIFSLRQDHWDAAGLTSWRPTVREAMAEFERQRGIRLEWVAAEHLTRGHPHCHLDLKATYQDRRGRAALLRLTRQDLADLRAVTLRILERERARRQRERAVAREIEQARQRAERELGRMIRMIGHAVEQAGREQEHVPPPPAPYRRRRPRATDRGR